MAVLPITVLGSPVLRQVTTEVAQVTDELRQLADDADNPEVTRAVRQFVAETGRKVLFFDDGLRQAAVIQ